MKLSDLHSGQEGMILSILTSEETKKRLQSFGIVERTRIECLQKSPFGDPTAYFVRGSVVALRKRYASKIEIALLRAR